MEIHQATNDSTTLIPTTAHPDGQQLSQYVGTLDAPKPVADTAAQNVLHSLDIPVDIPGLSKPADSSTSATAHEAAFDPSQALSDTRNALYGVAGAIENLYEHPGQIADAAKSALNKIENSKAVTLISDSLTEGVKDRQQLTPAGRGMVIMGEYGGI